MSDSDNYQQQSVAAAAAAIEKGHGDPKALREMLIWTTSKATCAMVEAYFQNYHHDKNLLVSLLSIAEEGEDAGDAPWAAANTISEFPANMLAEHEARLVELSQQQWVYLSQPAQQALAKVRANAT